MVAPDRVSPRIANAAKSSQIKILSFSTTTLSDPLGDLANPRTLFTCLFASIAVDITLVDPPDHSELGSESIGGIFTKCVKSLIFSMIGTLMNLH